MAHNGCKRDDYIVKVGITSSFNDKETLRICRSSHSLEHGTPLTSDPQVHDNVHQYQPTPMFVTIPATQTVWKPMNVALTFDISC